MKRIFSAAMLCMSSFLTPAHAAVIDFDALEAAGTSFQFMSMYEEDGYRLAGGNFASAQHGTTGWYAGSASLFNNSGGGMTVLSKIDGSAFSMRAIDLARVSTSYAGGAQVNFTGHVHGGGTVSQSFTVGEALAFQHFLLSGFNNLDSVTWLQSAPYHQFDNIDLRNQVPEPAPLALMALAMAALVARRRTKS